MASPRYDVKNAAVLAWASTFSQHGRGLEYPGRLRPILAKLQSRLPLPGQFEPPDAGMCMWEGKGGGVRHRGCCCCCCYRCCCCYWPRSDALRASAVAPVHDRAPSDDAVDAVDAMTLDAANEACGSSDSSSDGHPGSRDRDDRAMTSHNGSPAKEPLRDADGVDAARTVSPRTPTRSFLSRIERGDLSPVLLAKLHTTAKEAADARAGAETPRPRRLAVAESKDSAPFVKIDSTPRPRIARRTSADTDSDSTLERRAGIPALYNSLDATNTASSNDTTAAHPTSVPAAHLNPDPQPATVAQSMSPSILKRTASVLTCVRARAIGEVRVVRGDGRRD